MAHVPLSRFPIRVTSPEGETDVTALDDFAQTLRTELIDAGVRRIDRVSAGLAPDGARSLELVGILAFVITATDAGESVVKVVRAIRAVARRYAQARRPLRVTVGESDVDLATADDEQLTSVARVIAATAATAGTGVRAALIVANAVYDHAGLTELRAPGADADALARVLRDPAVGGFDVDLVTDGDERTIRRRLASFFAQRDHDDVLVLHFSCHGVKDFRGRLYFAARDTDLDALGATAVPAGFVNDLLDETQAGRVVLILDCCYSGAFARGATTRGDDAVHVNDEFGGGTGRVVLTASSATEYAFEGTAVTRADGQPSVFTGALVEGLATGAADLDGDGDITIDELYDYTYHAVRRATPGQAPMKWIYGVEGAVVIARSGRTPALPRTILDDIESDRGVLREEGVRALTRILHEGTEALREVAVRALTDLKDNDDSLRVREAAARALAPTSIPAQRSAPPDISARPEPRTPVPPTRERATDSPGRPSHGNPRTAAPRPAEHAAITVAQQAQRVTADPQHDRMLTGIRLAAAIMASLLGFVAAALYVHVISAYATDEIDSASTTMTYIALAAAGIVVVISRRRVWAAFLGGLLAWHTAFPVLVGTHSAKLALTDAWSQMLTVTVIGLVAFGFAIIAVMPAPVRTSGDRDRRFVAASVVCPLAIVTSILVIEVFVRIVDALPEDDRGPRIALAVAGGLLLPSAALLAPRHFANVWLLAGWLLGGALIAAGEFGLSDPSAWTPASWAALVATGVASLVVFRRANRSAPPPD